jgi:hypothetical protein
VDRYLKPARDRMRIKGISTTKPSPLLRNSIAIRTCADEAPEAPGVIEADTVAHCGPTLIGEFARTLTMTDLVTGWTENHSIRNNASKWIAGCPRQHRQGDAVSDPGSRQNNGSEFINHHLLHCCDQREITFTPSRPGNSNDGCHAGTEQRGDRAHHGRSSPLRHTSRTVAAQQDLGAAVTADELLLPATQTRLQGP